MCADTTTSPMRRTQESVTHVPGQLVTHVPSLYRACTVPRYGMRVNLAGRFRHSGAPNSSFPRSKACPVPRYGARIHALTPRGKMSIANPGTTNAVNVARGLVPRYGLPPAGNRSERTIRHPIPTPTIPVEAGFKPAWGGGKWQHPPAGRFRHSGAPTFVITAIVELAPYSDTGRESTHQSPTVKRRSNDRESLTRSM